MKTIKITTIVLASLALTFSSCKKKGCTDEKATNYSEEAKKDDGSCVFASKPIILGKQEITLKFTQNFNGVNVTKDNFNSLNYTNENNEKLSLTKLQYSISDVRFYKADGDSISIEMHHLIDLENESSLTLILDEKIDAEDYTSIGFNYGLSEEDNVSGAYTDFNLASWSWPNMIGGGYHQMKMEGRFIDSNSDTTSYQFHNGSATKNMSTGAVVVNYVRVNLENSNFKVDGAKSVEIKMNIDEWYKNPNVWNLDALHSMLMPNHNAQLMISANAKSVFTIGTIE